MAQKRCSLLAACVQTRGRHFIKFTAKAQFVESHQANLDDQFSVSLKGTAVTIRGEFSVPPQRRNGHCCNDSWGRVFDAAGITGNLFRIWPSTGLPSGHFNGMSAPSSQRFMPSLMGSSFLQFIKLPVCANTSHLSSCCMQCFNALRAFGPWSIQNMPIPSSLTNLIFCSLAYAPLNIDSLKFNISDRLALAPGDIPTIILVYSHSSWTNGRACFCMRIKSVWIFVVLWFTKCMIIKCTFLIELKLLEKWYFPYIIKTICNFHTPSMRWFPMHQRIYNSMISDG